MKFVIAAESWNFSPIYHLIEHTPVCLTHEVDMPLSCPRCDSQQITTLDYGRKTGTVVGTTAGAAGSAAATLGGAQTGAALGIVAGPVGSLFGGLAGALMGALIGGVAGGAAGAAIGEHVDDTLLDNYACQACGHTFGKRHLAHS
ncbi:hypothetical protein ACTJNK_11800 [Achromobacter anxifer]